MNVQVNASRPGRQRSTTPAQLSHIALQLFHEKGFDETTIDDIASAAGIGRRTFFRYFPSKNDLPWGDFDVLIERMRAHLAALPASVSLTEGLRAAVIDFNRFPEEEVPYHRRRMTLLLNVPSLVAHSALRYAEWRWAVAEFAAGRLGTQPEDLQAQVIAWSYLAASLSAYEQWLRHDDADLVVLLEQTFRTLDASFGPDAP